MGWNNPAMSWAELERRLSGLPGADDAPCLAQAAAARRDATIDAARDVTPYAELHCALPLQLPRRGQLTAEPWWRRPCGSGCTRSPLTDHDGFHAAPLLAEAAAVHGLSTVYGAELSLGLTRPQNGVPDPEGSHLLVLARGVEGYHRLAGSDDRGAPRAGTRRVARSTTSTSWASAGAGTGRC
jgi:error-prone DNA polymerase